VRPRRTPVQRQPRNRRAGRMRFAAATRQSRSVTSAVMATAVSPSSAANASIRSSRLWPEGRRCWIVAGQASRPTARTRRAQRARSRRRRSFPDREVRSLVLRRTVPREDPRASDTHHQHVILRGPSPVKAGSELMRGMTKAVRWSSSPSAARWKMVTQTYLIFSRLPR
jgi:hypothetical protein